MRKTDPSDRPRSYFRSAARSFQMNGGWFFATREGEQGPFRSQAAADRGVLRYVCDLEELREFQASRKPANKVQIAPSAHTRAVAKLREQAPARADLSLELSLEEMF